MITCFPNALRDRHPTLRTPSAKEPLSVRQLHARTANEGSHIVNTIEANVPNVDRGVRMRRATELTRYLVPLGRLMLVAIFLSAAPMHFARSGIDYAASQGVPLANVLVPISGILALLGGLSVLLGYRARTGALLLVLFLIPVTLMMHPFWGLADPHQMEIQRIMFLKNISILGGLLMVMHFGAGPISVDERSPITVR